MTVLEITLKYLEENNLGGLWDGDECSCDLDNLVPCFVDSFSKCNVYCKTPGDLDND